MAGCPAAADAHLGSIWEGTSNIVALDVQRADAREGSLDALRAHVAGLDPAVLLHFDRATTLLRTGGPASVRQAASALYHITSAAAMHWEGGRLGDASRIALARSVLTHRVLPRDPLADAAEAVP